MAIRTEMIPLINYLRIYGAAAEDDVYQNTVYWNDAQLQDILDRNAEHKDVLLRYYTPTTYALTCPRFHVFADDVVVINSSEAEIDAQYNMSFNEVTFETDQNASLWVRGLCVNMYTALSELWDIKASQRYDLVNFKAGNNRMDVKQELDNCIAKRDYYRSKIVRRFPRVSRRWTTQQ